MSGPPQEDPRRPLLQTVCHAGLLTLAAVMAEQAHQLTHLGLNSLSSLPLRQNVKISNMEVQGRVSGVTQETNENVEEQTNAQTTRLLYEEKDKNSISPTRLLHGGEETQRDEEQYTDSHISVSDEQKQTNAEKNGHAFVPDEMTQRDGEHADARSSRILPDEAGEEKKRDRPVMELPCAPIYSFDEDGDILQCVEVANPDTDEPRPTQKSPANNDGSFTDGAAHRRLETGGSPKKTCLHTPASENSQETTPCQEKGDTEREEAKTCSDPILASVGAAEETVPHIDLAEQSDTSDKHDSSAATVPEVTVVSEAYKAPPKINLQASSVEVEDDYLESHLEDDHLRDLYASLMAECGWQSRTQSTQESVMGLLSVTQPDPATRRTPKVPFDAVVFTERKPSTGDALVLSLGLAADGANSIQDIASRNQGAARERLQQGEVMPAEVKLTRQCESCGVSPEECLKKLGLHTEVVRPVASPKSERLLHFFKHIPADIHTRVAAAAAVAAAATTPLSDHEFTHSISSSKQKSRSLSSSPTNAEDDGRKSRLVAL